MEKKNNIKIKANDLMGRGEFLKRLGGGAAVTAAALAGCDKSAVSTSETLGEVPTDKMTYRVNKEKGDRVSILGYGCMRWPTRKRDDGEGEEIDQETVNGLVDYAIGHGINYFDTSPVYVRGWSEKATGIALSRHPRNSYFLATKLSNFSNHTRENSMLMYRRSFEELQTDYIDYYLLHSIGGSMGEFNSRYIDNGMLGFLIREREAGHIRTLGWSFHVR